MTKIVQFVLIGVCVAACIAEPARFRGRNNRFFARQEVSTDSAPPAKAPYPPAGLKPDIPFELPTETTTAQPTNTYLPPDTGILPDSTYGPPTTTDVPEAETETALPDVLLEDDDDTESVISVAVSYDGENVVLPEGVQSLVIGPRNGVRPQKLRALKAEPIILEDGSLAYSAQLQNWLE